MDCARFHRDCNFLRQFNFGMASLDRVVQPKLGIKEVDDGIWLASFMHYDLGYFDLEQKTLQPLDNPFGSRLSPMS